MARKQHVDEDDKWGDGVRWRQRDQWKTGEPNCANGWGEAGWWKQNDQQWDHPRRSPPSSGPHRHWARYSNWGSWVAADTGQIWGGLADDAAGKPPDSDTVAESFVAAEDERKLQAEKEEAARLEKKMLGEKQAEREEAVRLKKKMLAEKRAAEQMISGMTKSESQRGATLSKETAWKVSQFNGNCVL